MTIVTLFHTFVEQQRAELEKQASLRDAASSFYKHNKDTVDAVGRGALEYLGAAGGAAMGKVAPKWYRSKKNRPKGVHGALKAVYNKMGDTLLSDKARHAFGKGYNQHRELQALRTRYQAHSRANRYRDEDDE